MEVALRRRLEGVATISISEQRQTAEVTFAPGPHPFSPAAFREAVKEAAVEVVSFEVEACGTVEERDHDRWLAAGANRFRLANAASLTAGQFACLSGALDDQATPQTLTVRTVEPSR